MLYYSYCKALRQACGIADLLNLVTFYDRPIWDNELLEEMHLVKRGVRGDIVFVTTNKKKLCQDTSMCMTLGSPDSHAQ